MLSKVKSVPQLAADITRRFLPEGKRFHALALEMIARRSAYEDLGLATARRVAELLNLKLRFHGPSEGYHIPCSKLGSYGIEISGGNVSFKLSAPIEKLKAVIALLA